jgi:hypothetical protein
MTPLEIITARRMEIAKIRADLDLEDSELAIAERVWARLASSDAPVGPPPRIKLPNDGQLVNGSRQQTEALALLPEDGAKMTREEFHQAINATRSAPLTENAFITLLSRMRTGNLIITEHGSVRRKMEAQM